MLSKIEKAVTKAGEHLLKGFNSVKEISYKGKIDIVTQFDVEVEKILLNELSFMMPEYGFVAEETAQQKTDKKKVVYIDPIDGTTNFVHGFPFCCVSVGVYEEGEGIYGVIYNPILREMFIAEKGQGAYLNRQKIQVSSKHNIQEALVATGFPYSIAEGNPQAALELLGTILKNTRGIRRAGSAALDLCYVAKGVFDAYYEFDLSPWDIAAGAVIAGEAEAHVCGKDFSKSPDMYEKFIMAVTPDISDRLHKMLFM
ncbi:inositol monophosphatase [Denitrovibrio acetiphilus DSM 12809]|uniref:Inositol-1-monophosphatase n=1 Tax=Denitrovibrio acetiphilus (strain DSM 12809 / NBRC 114555 / N2460) TaxID=522772 RepID=D4H7D3_DENA2|nr:inositol monophosphatase family protein [Denitrovibrio acetiphilus]ADD67932.1 inositol monophosphatase [Denitrovibrio acetiphilus DSM 12809]